MKERHCTQINSLPKTIKDEDKYGCKNPKPMNTCKYIKTLTLFLYIFQNQKHAGFAAQSSMLLSYF